MLCNDELPERGTAQGLAGKLGIGAGLGSLLEILLGQLAHPLQVGGGGFAAALRRGQVGRGLGALVVHMIWTQAGREPHAFVVVVAAVLGALGALAMQRYVIILGTAFGGASTMLLGILELAGHPAAAAAAERSDVIVVYPIPPAGAEGPADIATFFESG